MDLMLEHNRVAELGVRAVGLRPAVGAFDLLLMTTIAPTKAGAFSGQAATPRWIRIDGLELFVHPRGQNRVRLATLRVSAPTWFAQADGNAKRPLDFQAQLAPRQLLALEDLRDGGALALQVQAFGVGGLIDDPVGHSTLQGDGYHTVAQSDWIAQLKGAGALGVILLETSLPLSLGATDDDSIARQLHIAEKAFHTGDYQNCVGACRLAYERLKLGPQSKLKTPVDAKTLSFPERIELLLASARHATQLAHHDDGGALSAHVYSRDEARLLLQVTAAAVAYRLRR